MAFADLHEGILEEFVTAGRTRRGRYMSSELRAFELHIIRPALNSLQCAARQREQRRDPIAGDAYRAKLAAARRAKYAADPAFREQVLAAKRRRAA
jgi:hypothetical protein